MTKFNMRYSYPLFLLFIFVLFSCNSTTVGQEIDNTKPMYGEVPKNEEYKKADEEFKKDCLDKFKTLDSSVAVQMDLGWRYFYNNDLKTAMKRFNQAWLLNPEFPDAYFAFAALMDMQGNVMAAKRFYTLAKAKDKTTKRAEICYQRIADCKEHLEDVNGTIEAYANMADVNPTNSFAFKKIGYFQMQSGNSEKAIEAYNRAIELDPTDAVTYNNRAYLYQGLKNYKNAIADYSKAIDLNPKYISAYVNRGITKIAMKDNLGAKHDFEMCVQLDSKDSGLRRILGLAKLNLKDKAGACEDFELAKRLGDAQAAELIRKNCN